MIKCFFSISLLFSICLAAQAQSTHKLLREGDSAYDFENYKEAEKHYRDAADLQYGDPLAQYNLGNALYQQGNWEDAATRFQQAAGSATEAAFKADALHNFGNTQMKLNKFEEAVEAYESSLRLRPGDAGTKQNLQMAKKKLEKEKQQQQEEQEQQNQEQKQPQDPQNQQNNQQQNQEQKQQNQGQGQPEQPSQPQQQPQEQPLEKLKKEDAERLLETAIGPEDQKNARKYREQRQQPKPGGKGKDW